MQRQLLISLCLHFTWIFIKLNSPLGCCVVCMCWCWSDCQMVIHGTTERVCPYNVPYSWRSVCVFSTWFRFECRHCSPSRTKYQNGRATNYSYLDIGVQYTIFDFCDEHNFHYQFIDIINKCWLFASCRITNLFIIVMDGTHKQLFDIWHSETTPTNRCCWTCVWSLLLLFLLPFIIAMNERHNRID